MAAVHATRALALVGTPFRPQGRDAEFGLDCIGLCLAVYRLPRGLARENYRLRGNHLGEIEGTIEGRFRRLRPGQGKPGDLLLMMPSADQAHLGILTRDGFIHADARLRRVVERPGPPAWPVAAIYRLRRG